MSKKQVFISRQNMLSTEYEIFNYKDTYLKEVKLHHHDFYEIYFFISGEVKYLIEGKIFKLVPGDIVIVNSNQLHQPILEEHAKPYERIVLWIDKQFVRLLSTPKTDLAKCFEERAVAGKNVLKFPFELSQNLRVILMKLLDCRQEETFGSDLEYKIYITEILLCLNKASIQEDESYVRVKTDIKNSSLIQGVIAFVEEHIDEEIPLDILAKEFYISKYYLSREFKKYTGTTIHRYMIQKKLISAKELILEGIPLIEIYKRIGFGDYCNFLRAFKKEYGITPKEFYNFMINKREVLNIQFDALS